MKKTGKWVLSVITKTLVIILVILLLPFAKNIFSLILPDATGEIRIQSAVLQQKLESSKRLEVTSIDETGVLVAETNVIVLGTVGKTTIRYRYTASVGIDLSKVIMTEDSDRIIFSLPDPEVLNDGIEPLEIHRQDFFSKAIDKSIEELMSEQRVKCREQYLEKEQYTEQTWDNTVQAFQETICSWLESFGERHYMFEFVRQDQTGAV